MSPTEAVTVEFGLIQQSDGEVLIIRVQDPDLDRYVKIGKKGGLGIFIMRKLLDEIDYRHTEEGNELRLTKFRDKKGIELLHNSSIEAKLPGTQ